jgi:Spy/CpxP family protein refolding chaperone
MNLFRASLAATVFAGVVACAGVALAQAPTSKSAAIASSPASCQDVRNLSTAEQDYWSRRLNLTRAQRHQIWVACFRAPSDDHARALPAANGTPPPAPSSDRHLPAHCCARRA